MEAAASTGMTTRTDRDASSAPTYDLRRHVNHLYGMGRRFCAAAARPVAHAATEHTFQNIHWGLEVVLKAYLTDHGWTDERCITEIRHDIALALAACEEEGLADIEDGSRALVQALSPLSKRHQVAEFVKGGANGFTPKQAITAAENIVSAVGQALKRQAGRGTSSPAAEPVVSPDPFCGDTPQRPERKRAAAVAVTE